MAGEAAGGGGRRARQAHAAPGICRRQRRPFGVRREPPRLAPARAGGRTRVSCSWRRSHIGRRVVARVSRQRIFIHPTAALSPEGIDDVVKKFYRLGANVDMNDPDDLNLLVVRLASTIEQVCKRLLADYLESHPEDDTVEAVVRRDSFESFKSMTWPEAVAASRNISTINDACSILDKCGLSRVLDRETASVLGSIMIWRNRVVHEMEDARIDGRVAYSVTEGWIRNVFLDDSLFIIRMCITKAGEAEAHRGGPWLAYECYEEAIVLCDKTGAVDSNPAVLACKGGALAALGRHDEALEAYDMAAGIDADDATAHHGRGLLLYTMGRHDEALEAYDIAVGIDPEYAGAYAGRGDALAALGRHDGALEAYDIAVGIDPEYAGAYAGRGDALTALGRHDEALEAYGRAVGIDADDIAAHHGRGLLLYTMDRHDEALEAYDMAAGIDPEYADAHAGRGDALAALGRHDEALEAYDIAVGIDPEYADAHAGRGDALAALGRHDEALEAYDIAVGIDPEYADAHAGRGDALAALGRHNEAQIARDTAARLARNRGSG